MPTDTSPSRSAAERTALVDPFRLQALDALELLDAGADEGFDNARRQYFIGRPRLLEELATAGQVGVEGSLCRHAVESGEPLVMEDAHMHPLFSESASVTGLGIAGYAGIRLVTSEEGYARDPVRHRCRAARVERESSRFSPVWRAR